MNLESIQLQVARIATTKGIYIPKKQHSPPKNGIARLLFPCGALASSHWLDVLNLKPVRQISYQQFDSFDSLKSMTPKHSRPTEMSA